MFHAEQATEDYLQGLGDYQAACSEFLIALTTEDAEPHGGKKMDERCRKKVMMERKEAGERSAHCVHGDSGRTG